MERLAMVLLRHRVLVLVAWAVLCIIGGAFAAGLPGRIVSGGEAPSSSQSEVVARTLTASHLPSLFVAIQVPLTATTADQVLATRTIAAAAQKVDGVTAVTPMPNSKPAEANAARITVLNLATSGGTDGAVKTAHALSAAVRHAAPRGVVVHVGGFGAYRDELTVDSQRDLERAERVGLPIVLVVLLFTFDSTWAASLPVVIAISALMLGLGGVGVASFFLPMSDFVTNSASMIGLALGVDYAMFLLHRVRELRAEGRSTDESVIEAMRTTGAAILWSGITVIAAESTLLLVDSRSIRSAAFGMAVVSLFAVGTALTVGPVLMSALGDRVAPSHRHRANTTASLGWQRWARQVTGRGPIWLVASAMVMLSLAVPVVHLHSKVSIEGTTTLPTNSSVRAAYELAGERYGPAAMSPTIVLLAAKEHPGVVDRVRDAVSRDPQVAEVSTIRLPSGSWAVVVTGKSDPYSPEARALVARLRTGSVHTQLGGVHYLVGGETATDVDATAGMFAGLPKVAVALLVVIGALLLLALRSVFLPLKAVALVVLSLGASIGSLLVLTTTHLGALMIGARAPQDIHPIIPITIVAVTVALSTDYEVILISRIAEHYRRSRDNKAAVIYGLEHTGSTITSAAAIMVAVFAGFALADLAPIKQLGVGLGLAVFLDATVVRGMLVPATMAVMGRRNWWWPSWSRLRHRVTPHAGPARSEWTRFARLLAPAKPPISVREAETVARTHRTTSSIKGCTAVRTDADS
jgi:RND superfamily putative drug exporter